MICLENGYVRHDGRFPLIKLRLPVVFHICSTVVFTIFNQDFQQIVYRCLFVALKLRVSVESFKYLGVVLSSNFTLSEHVA